MTTHDPDVLPNHQHVPGDVKDSSLFPLIQDVLRDGFVIIPNAFSPETVAAAKKEIEVLSKSPVAGVSANGGRNSFEGHQTARIYALLNKSRRFDEFCMHPTVMALNDYFLSPGYLITAFHTICIQPGETAQSLHNDDGFINVPRPHPPFGTAIMVALDDYTADNGSTVVIPSSHTWGSTPLPRRSDAIPVVMPSGSLVFFLSTLWHGGGSNTSSAQRRALTVQYCQPWCRQMENQVLAVDWENLHTIHPKIVDMLGYKILPPFIGNVDGAHPLKAIKKIAEKYKQAGREADTISKL
ncbi:hypothetical protein B0J14DRAFT_600299 [Halenospora varia]|nr:hypothetical protein B0J14DRAFT_600299 [Halenospora varia]